MRKDTSLHFTLTGLQAAFVYGGMLFLRLTRSLPNIDPVLARTLCCAVTVAATTSVTAGAEAERRSYNLPAGDAARTLTLFAEISGKQILFMVGKVRGQRTHAISGEMLPVEAIGRMLAGTDLVAVEDPRTGAFVVSRKERQEASGPEEGSQRSQEPTPNPTSMKKASLLRRTLAIISAAAAPWTSAQDEPQPNAAPPDSTVVLSPFEVSSTQDRGYAAQNTLAGSRVSTDLKDLPAAISVFNEQFINDIAAADLMQAIEYGMGTRPDLDEGRSAGPIGEGFNNNDRGIRIRGLPGARRTRNYFVALGEIDTYNKGRLEFSRGPNSILNGFGSPAGVINASTKQAQLNRKFATFSARLGEWDEQRYTADINLPLLKDRLGVRLNYLHQESESWRDFGHNDGDAVHLAATWKIDEKTTLRVEGEIFDRKVFTPRPWIANDNIDGWLAAGRPTYNPFRGNGRPGAPNTAFAGLAGIRNIGVKAIYLHNAGVGYDWSNLGRGQSGNPSGVNNSFNFDLYHRPETVMEGGGVGGEREFRQLGASLERRLLPDLYLELAADYQEFDSLAYNMGDAGDFGLDADTSEFLPTGAPNPYAGKFYMEQNLRSDVSEETQKSLRATLLYQKDLGGWGRHSFGGMAERRDAVGRYGIWRELWIDVSDPSNLRPGFHNNNFSNINNRVRRRVYFTDDQIASMRGVHWISPLAEPIGTIDFIDPTPANPTATRRLEARLMPAQNNQDNRDQTDALLFVTQNHWLKNHVVTFFGYREESLQHWDSTSALDAQGFPLPFGVRNPDPEPTVRGVTRNYGVVARPPVQALRWLSLFYNHATSSSVGGGSSLFGPFGGVQPPAPRGETDDFGVKLDLFEGRLFMTLARYETSARNDVASFSSLANNFETALTAAIDAGIVTTANFDPGADGILESDDVLGGNADTFDSKSDGWELELFLNPSRNFRMTLNYALQETVRTNQTPRLRRIVDEFKPLLLQGDTPRVLLSQDLGNPGIERSTNIFDLNDEGRNIAEALRDAELNYLQQVALFEGTAPNGHTKHRLNAFANYTFKEGRLKNVSVGLGARYRSGTVAGFVARGFEIPTDLARATSASAGIDPSEISEQFETDDELFFDLKLGYERRLSFGQRQIPWSIQVNVRNVLDMDERRLTQVFIDGAPRQYRLGTPRQILVTNTFRF